MGCSIWKCSKNIPSTSCTVPFVVLPPLGVSMCITSLPIHSINLSMLKPLLFCNIPSIASNVRCTAICLLYSSPLTKDLHNLPICISAGDIKRQCPSFTLGLTTFWKFGEYSLRSFNNCCLNSFKSFCLKLGFLKYKLAFLFFIQPLWISLGFKPSAFASCFNLL